MYSSKRGDGDRNDDGDDGARCYWDCNEEQESRPLVCCGVRETATPGHYECRKLIHDFNHDDYSCPHP